MAQQNEDYYIKAVILDFLTKKDPALASIFQKKTSAGTLTQRSATLTDVISHFLETSEKKIELTSQLTKKASSSDSSSESDDEAPAKPVKSVSKPLTNGTAALKVTKTKAPESSDDSSEDSDDKKTPIVNKTNIASSKGPSAVAKKNAPITPVAKKKRKQ
ncbi:uncharacterized protein LOC135849043 [Planococcus citri]|uniref:uncharacterized protein LOC135849043 n=1 Tax=Planococcus citri TaxID=170843 RepID=UPI0031F8BC80